MRVEPHLRPMTAADIARLGEIDANFASPHYLDVRKETDGLNVTWRLIQRPLNPPFICTDYVFDQREQKAIRRRLTSGDGLWLVAEVAGRLVGLADIEHRRWNNSAWVWHIAVDREWRRRGVGTRLMRRVVAWGRRKELRAIMLETQTNNWPACRFYLRFGFRLTGLDDHYYTNRDIAQKEVALFWTFEL